MDFKMHDRKRAGHKMGARCAHVWPWQYVIVIAARIRQGAEWDAAMGNIWPTEKLYYVAAVATKRPPSTHTYRGITHYILCQLNLTARATTKVQSQQRAQSK